MTSGQGWRKHKDDEKIDFLTFSILPYEEGISLQRRLNREMIENGQGEYIILCEHEPVYTCGIHHEGYPENIDPLYIIERGGGVTFHGPGQITCYFLIDLGKRNMNIVDLIHFAHQSEIMYLENYSVNAISQLGKKQVSGSIIRK
jgi:Lipoate-protein ligase B